MWSLRKLLNAVIVASSLFITAQFTYIGLQLRGSPRLRQRSDKSSMHTVTTTSRKLQISINGNGKSPHIHAGFVSIDV